MSLLIYWMTYILAYLCQRQWLAACREAVPKAA